MCKRLNVGKLEKAILILCHLKSGFPQCQVFIEILIAVAAVGVGILLRWNMQKRGKKTKIHIITSGNTRKPESIMETW